MTQNITKMDRNSTKTHLKCEKITILVAQNRIRHADKIHYWKLSFV